MRENKRRKIQNDVTVGYVHTQESHGSAAAVSRVATKQLVKRLMHGILSLSLPRISWQSLQS